MCSCMYLLAYAGQPAVSSFIPPSVDSIILDYQSPNTQPGFYPNEDSSDGGIGEIFPSVIQAIPLRLLKAGWETAEAPAGLRNLHVALLHSQMARQRPSHSMQGHELRRKRLPVACR